MGVSVDSCIKRREKSSRRIRRIRVAGKWRGLEVFNGSLQAIASWAPRVSGLGVSISGMPYSESRLVAAIETD
ncbi:hypothetical protein HMEPL2_17250 [Vreelandella aquamarina]|uniref:Uncharacterized protein n=1 Tax=Vreelandella aquamarina TaxID=77097 RepID=A0A6F8XCB0_9GAMM|nr:hypothetical protein HMSLTHF_27560 [Halomonas meridiana]BCB71374.1 hypothetical protein HMEPL2_17250 [Halomonas meridiana]